MSSSAALAQVSAALKSLLEEALLADPVLQTVAFSVVLLDPSKPPMAGANANRVSLWLYQVVPDEFLRNLPPTPVANRVAGQKALVKPPPLVLNLYFLVTPLMGSPDFDQRALGAVMLTLHQTPVVRLHSPGDAVTEEVRIGLVTEPAEDRARLWEAIQQPYRLSACYLVRSVRLEADPQLEGPRVGEVEAGLADSPEADIAE